MERSRDFIGGDSELDAPRTSSDIVVSHSNEVRDYQLMDQTNYSEADQEIFI
jgi:hypothetical protein